MAVMTRSALCHRIDAMREKYGIRGVFDPFAFAEERGIPIAYHAFAETRIRGILVRTEDHSGIILDPRLTPAQQRFTLAHELVHLELHYGTAGSGAFHDSGGEYQADEGAAELLMPYRDFIPRAASLRRRFLKDRTAALGLLASHYRLDLETVRRRLVSLEHELALYRSGVPISEIEPLSRQRRQALRLHDRPFDRRPQPVSAARIDVWPDGPETD